MSQPSLSASSVGPAGSASPASSATASSPVPRHIDAREMRGLLPQLFAGNREANFLWQLSQRLKDPLKEGEDGRFRMNPIWVALGILVLLALSCFIYFTFKRS
jgi:hypothetical protein